MIVKKIIHANRIRKYVTKAMNCGVILEEEEHLWPVFELLLISEV